MIRPAKKLEDYLPLFYQIGNYRSRIGGGRYTAEDLAHEAWLRLQNTKVDLSKPKLLANIIDRRIIDYIRKRDGRLKTDRNKGLRRTLTFSNLFHCDEDNKHYDIFGCIDESREEVGDLEEFEYMIGHSGFTGEEKLILRLFFIDNLQQDVISRVIGVTPSRISQKMTNMLMRLKDVLTEKNSVLV